MANSPATSKEFERQRKLLAQREAIDAKVSAVCKANKTLTRNAENSLATLLEFCGLSPEFAAMRAAAVVFEASETAASDVDSPLYELL